MRKRNARKSRSIMVLDLKKLYAQGVTTDFFRPIDVPVPTDDDFEIQFCEEILSNDAAHFEAMIVLGDAYTRRGEYQKGLDLDLRLSRIRPENNLVRYNLACSYALTGQKEKALNTLTKAIELGYCDLEHILQDHDLDAVKGDPRFQNILSRLAATQHEETY